MSLISRLHAFLPPALLTCTQADSADAVDALASIDVTLTSAEDVGLGCEVLTTDGTCGGTAACCGGILVSSLLIA